MIAWPTFHLNQLALGLAGVVQFTFIPPALAAAVLAGVTVLCRGLATGASRVWARARVTLIHLSEDRPDGEDTRSAA